MIINHLPLRQQTVISDIGNNQPRTNLVHLIYV